MTTSSSACLVCGDKRSASEGEKGLRKRCQECGQRRRERCLLPLARMRKRVEFVRYLKDFGRGELATLAEMQTLYQITATTALRWRLKALACAGAEIDALPVLSGDVEADELFFARGEPGARAAPAKAARPSRKRGSDRLRGKSTRDTVAIVTAIERGSNALVLRSGRSASTDLIQAALEGSVAKKSVLMTDGWAAYAGVASSLDLKHIKLLRGRASRSSPWKHINTINGLHARLRKFLDRFNGLKSQTIQLYLHWFQLRESHQLREKIQQMANSLGFTPCPTCGR